MAARRKRRRRRRGRFGFLYKFLSTIVILGAIVAGCIVFFRVEKITISGSEIYTDEEIILASGVEMGDNLFLVRRMRAAQQIRSQLPYINDVNLRWALPDGLVINVTECIPAGVLADEAGDWWVMDSKGKLLEQGGSELAQRYPQITGLTMLTPSTGSTLMIPAEESTKLNSLKSLLAALESREMMGQVQSIDLTSLSEIRMGYEDRFTVRIPMYSDDFSGLTLWLQSAADYLDSGQTGIIDLTGQGARFIPN